MSRKKYAQNIVNTLEAWKKGECYMTKKEGEDRLTKIENKVNRLCKHVGKLTNKLRQGKTKTLQDLPVAELDDDALLQDGVAEKPEWVKTMASCAQIIESRLKVIEEAKEREPFKEYLDRWCIGVNREEEKVLCLDISPVTGALRILYKKHSEKANSDIHLIGQITDCGEMVMLSSSIKHKRYEEWQKADKVSPNSTIDQTSIIWRGAEYAIISRPLGFGTYGGYYLKNVTIGQAIYNFSTCLPCSPISDIHIKKYSNGTPMLF